MTKEQVQVHIIERLRQAAKEHVEVADLLYCLAVAFRFAPDGDFQFHGDSESANYLKSAVIASAFVEYDGGQD
jgi:hypothetical protein